MKTLSLWQPWASAIAWGEKNNETRSWGTEYRGLVAIHATATEPAEARQAAWESTLISAAIRRHVPTVFSSPGSIDRAVRNLPHSCIVAVAEISEVFRVAAWGTSGVGRNLLYYRLGNPEVQGYRLDDNEGAFGDYSIGRFVWRLTDIRPLKTPVSCRGSQGLRDLPADITALVEEQL